MGHLTKMGSENLWTLALPICASSALRGSRKSPSIMPQVQGCMLVTGRKWWDFSPFDSRQDEECQLYVETIYRDEEYIANLLIELVQFNLELNLMVDEVADKARAQAHRLGAA